MKYPDFIIKTNEALAKVGLDLYVLLLGIGIIVLIEYVIYGLEKRNGFSRKETNKLILFLAISLIGAYLFAMLFDSFFHYLKTGVFRLESITYIGGFIGGLLFFILLIYFFYPEQKGNILKILNIIIPGVILAHAIGRVGCFTAGCCYGRPTNSIFGVFFPEGTNPYFAGIREPIHPTQLYEALYLIILFFIITKVSVIKEHKLASYLIGYGVFRAILEAFFRGDERGSLFGIAPSLILSILMVISGIIILIMTLKKNERKRILSE